MNMHASSSTELPGTMREFKKARKRAPNSRTCQRHEYSTSTRKRQKKGIKAGSVLLGDAGVYSPMPGESDP